MLSDAMRFWESIAGKVKQLIRGETQNAFRCERYEVSTAANGTVMGVKKPYGEEILLPYSNEVANAAVGDPVLVVWWGSMSNAKVYYFANGYEGTTGGGGGGGDDVVIATITFPLSWNDSGNGYYTVTPTISGVLVSTDGKVDIQPTAAQTMQLQSDGVTSLYVENNAGTLTAYAVGNAPSVALTMQCTVETTDSTTGAIGDTVGVSGKWKTLWTNPNPTGSFPAQTIQTGDLSRYSFIGLCFFVGQLATKTGSLIIAPNDTGKIVSIYGAMFGTSSQRDVTINASSVYISAKADGNNNLLIPLGIYGMP